MPQQIIVSAEPRLINAVKEVFNNNLNSLNTTFPSPIISFNGYSK